MLPKLHLNWNPPWIFYSDAYPYPFLKSCCSPYFYRPRACYCPGFGCLGCGYLDSGLNSGFHLSHYS